MITWNVNICHHAAQISLLWEQWVQLFVVCWKLPFTNLPSEESLSKRAPWLLSSESFCFPVREFLVKQSQNLPFKKISKWFLCPVLFEKHRAIPYRPRYRNHTVVFFFFFQFLFTCCLFRIALCITFVITFSHSNKHTACIWLNMLQLQWSSTDFITVARVPNKAEFTSFCRMTI